MVSHRSLDINKRLAQIFDSGIGSLSHRLDNFPKFARRQKITRFLSLYEIFKKIIPVKGSIVECGVNSGFSLFTWAHLSSILEMNNITRMVYGFDTFDGFSNISEKDNSIYHEPQKGEMSKNSYEELLSLIDVYNDNRFLGNLPKIKLIKGDLAQTAPKFIEQNQHLIVAMLFIDLDLYEPTKVALETFLPRMHKGSLLVMDELDHPQWPGETLALLEKLDLKGMEIKRVEFDPYISYMVLN